MKESLRTLRRKTGSNLGLLTGFSEVIRGHSRLLRSLSWGDEDYAGNVLDVLSALAARDPTVLDKIEFLLAEKYPDETHFVSAKPARRKITFAPHAFEVPDVELEPDLVAVMMPFDAAFDRVHEVIKNACACAGLRCLRADNIWEHSVVIQDIFRLILRSRTVVVDFSTRNPNVMYETGIAHTLGKLVVPISQSIDDVPFDLKHHRVLTYLPNNEGFAKMENALSERLAQLAN